MDDSSEPYGLLNAARNEIFELKRKNANQQLLISHLEEEVRQLTQEEHPETAAIPSSQRDIDPELHNEMQKLIIRNTEVESEKECLTRQVNQLEADVKLQQMEIDQLRAENERISTEGAEFRRNVKSKVEQARRLELEVQRLTEQIKELEAAPDDEDPVALRQKLNAREAELTDLTERHRCVNSVLGEVRSRLSSTVHVQRQFIEQMQAEFERVAMLHEKERQKLLAENDARVASLQSEYTAFRRLQHDDKRRLLREHQQTLSSIQAQFDEYRTTAEFLFSTEAAKFEDKLNSQMLKFDMELRFVIRAKDKLFDDMVAAKDGKIMSLIDGSDFQAMLIKHELDLEQMRRSHEKDVENVKQTMRTEKEHSIAGLKKELAGQRSVEEKMRGQTRSLEATVKDLTQQLQAKDESWAEREGYYSQQHDEWQARADQLSGDIRSLIRDRAALRHKLVRLKYTANPAVSQSVDVIVRNLTQALQDLQEKYSSVADHHQVSLAELDRLRLQNRGLLRAKDTLQLEVDRLMSDYSKITEAFEAIVSSDSKSAGSNLGGTAPVPRAPSAGKGIEQGAALLRRFRAINARMSKEASVRERRIAELIDGQVDEEDAVLQLSARVQDVPPVGALVDETGEVAARNSVKVYKPAKKKAARKLDVAAEIRGLGADLLVTTKMPVGGHS
ncbi:Chromosome partition protein Smc [Carpediemonas membranifera]|uniref:Chromosome partition protein Smc n=1 Tax=Carpediemonas membranifera TaxID=201153 RepID=A0A8J6AQN9_9EUKA|nr:Chromosome partition protein Smc [Carpediemonas membranifera]|eukprot:KAG9391711.1 Chromosome partition protein Smc [Carpediemonas membranifera]